MIQLYCRELVNYRLKTEKMITLPLRQPLLTFPSFLSMQRYTYLLYKDTQLHRMFCETFFHLIIYLKHFPLNKSLYNIILNACITVLVSIL